MRKKKLLAVCIFMIISMLFTQTALASVTLKLGSRGNDVKKMQQTLKELGFLSGSVDGIFGRQTLEAVKGFQKRAGLKVDGIAGKLTFSKLYASSGAPTPTTPTVPSGGSGVDVSSITRTLRIGCRGEDVKILQKQLNELNFSVGKVDGIFGGATANAVKKFQQSKGLKVDGIVGKNTISKLCDSNAKAPSTDQPKAPVEDNKGDIGKPGKIIAKGTVTASMLNVRKGPNTSYAILGQVSLNAKVDILGESSDGWYIIQWGNGNAYVSGKYVRSEKIEEPPTDRGEEERPTFQPWRPSSGKISLVWHYNPNTMNISAEGINVVAPVWFEIALKDNEVIIGGIYGNRVSKDYIDAAHGANYQVWGTIQSMNADLSKQIVTNQELGDRIINRMVELVQNYNMDGLNIDFEYMDPNDKDLFTDFVARATSSLHKIGATVSIDVTKKSNSSSNWWSSCYDRAALAQIVDYVMLMSYDQRTYSSPTNGAVAEIGWVEDSIKSTLTEVPAEKLLIGIPTFAYDWYYVPNKDDADVNNPADYTRPSRFSAIGMGEINSLVENEYALLRSGERLEVSQWLTSPIWMEKVGAMHMRFVDTQGRIHELWYENSQSIGVKLDLVEKYNLAGAATWQYIFADENIWETFAEKLNISMQKK